MNPSGFESITTEYAPVNAVHTIKRYRIKRLGNKSPNENV